MKKTEESSHITYIEVAEDVEAKEAVKQPVKEAVNEQPVKEAVDTAKQSCSRRPRQFFSKKLFGEQQVKEAVIDSRGHHQDVRDVQDVPRVLPRP